MLRYAIKRLLLMIPVVIGVSFLIFFIMDLAPGNIIDTKIAEESMTDGKCGKSLPRKCPSCGAETIGNMKFCGECGAPLRKTCPNCGKTADNGIKFCPDCGSKLEENGK